ADALVLLDRRGRLAEHEGVALGREEQAQEQLDGGGLARAVGAEQAEDLAALDRQVQGAERGLLAPAPEVAVDLGEVARLDDRFQGHGRPPSGRGAGRCSDGIADAPQPYTLRHPELVRRRAKVSGALPLW